MRLAIALLAAVTFAAACSALSDTTNDTTSDNTTDSAPNDNTTDSAPNDNTTDSAPNDNTTDDSSATEDPQAGSSSTDGPLPDPEYIPETTDGRPFLELDLTEKIEALLSMPNTTFAQSIATEMGSSGDPRWGPWLLDLMRLGGTQGIIYSTTWAFEQISGINSTGDFSVDFVTYGTWLRAEQIHPGTGYHDWKRRLFGALIYPPYDDLLGSVTDPLVLASIQWGGVRRGGIPELNNPTKLTPAEATFMTDAELVLGAVVNGEAVAYPLRFMARHEFANDVIGGVPVALGYCTLCRTGLLFDSRVDGEVLTFQTSGLLLDSNKVMVDNQTDSLWQHLAGEAISGPYKGTVLDTFPLVTTLWSDWLAKHPDTVTLDTPPPTYLSNQPERPPVVYDYTPGAAYAYYYANENLWFPSLPTPGPFQEKTGVVTLSRPGGEIAFEVEGLEQSPPFTFGLGAEQLVVVPNVGGARIYLLDGGLSSGLLVDGAGELWVDAIVDVTHDTLTLSDSSELTRVVSGQSFWFAWAGLHPDTHTWTLEGGLVGP